MKRNKTKKKLNLGEQAEMAMREAVAEIILEHRKTGRPLIIWKNNRVAKVSPFKVQLP